MEIAARQKFLASFLQPLFFGHGLTFRAVSVSAGIVAVSDGSALITDLLMASKPGCSACHNSRYDFTLITIHGMGFSVFFAILTEDVGNLVLWPHFSTSWVS
jgi:hypothetical protein